MLCNKKNRKVLLLFLYSVNIFAEYIPNLTELFPQVALDPIILKNRETLAMVPQWIDDHSYKNAFYWYGLPECVRHLIDEPMGNEITYTDAIIYLTRFLKKDIKYLELGTSFGKNFVQIEHAISNGTLVAFDIETISPVMESFLTNKQELDRWETVATYPWGESSLKKGKSSLTSYDQKTNNNHILYLSGDVFDENSWKRLKGKHFNLIFSDACHAPMALLNEYQMIEKYGLLDDDEFIFVWDDLGGEMSQAFFTIFDLLSKKYNLKPEQGFVIPLRGWLGINCHHHWVGIIMHIKQ